MNKIELSGKLIDEPQIFKDDDDNSQELFSFTLEIETYDYGKCHIRCGVWKEIAKDLKKHLSKNTKIWLTGVLVTQDIYLDDIDMQVGLVMANSITLWDNTEITNKTELEFPKWSRSKIWNHIKSSKPAEQE